MFLATKPGGFCNTVCNTVSILVLGKLATSRYKNKYVTCCFLLNTKRFDMNDLPFLEYQPKDVNFMFFGSIKSQHMCFLGSSPTTYRVAKYYDLSGTMSRYSPCMCISCKYMNQLYRYCVYKCMHVYCLETHNQIRK